MHRNKDPETPATWKTKRAAAAPNCCQSIDIVTN